jgi:pyruvate kinase
MMPFKVICTIGGASLNDEVLLGLKLRNVAFFRINLSHTPKTDIVLNTEEETIEKSVSKLVNYLEQKLNF